MRVRSLLAALGLSGTTFLASNSANAYDGVSHQRVVELAWDVMLASQDPSLRGRIDSREVDLRALGTTASSSDKAQYGEFLAAVKTSMLRLNRMPSGVPGGAGVDPHGFSCASLDAQKTLGRCNVRIGPGYMGSDYPVESDDDYPATPSCQGTADVRYGIFNKIGTGASGLAGDFGDTQAQGMLLGWHAKRGDDGQYDMVISENLLASILNTEIVAPGVSIKSIFEVSLGTIIAPFACIWSIFSHKNCFRTTRRLAEQYDPVTVVEGVWPAMGVRHGGDFTTMTHFIDAMGNTGFPDNWYDDRRGLFYESAGPNWSMSALDMAIIVGIDTAGLVVDPDKSLAVSNYDWGESAGDTHPTVTGKRSNWSWGRDTLAHTQMTPLDNFGLYGWHSFRADANRSLTNLRWPLHAVGDCTIPHHIAMTTGWGHVPYETAVGELWWELLYVEGMYAGEYGQYSQAQRILREAFTIWQRVQAWRSAGNYGWDFPVRDLLSELAVTTWNESTHTLDGQEKGWPWCDECSTDWALPKGDDQTQTYVPYKNEMRHLVEHAAAYSLAFLVFAGDAPFTPKCAEAGEACTRTADGNTCCVGTCESNICNTPPPTCTTGQGKDCFSCATDDNCKSPITCGLRHCVNGFCESGTECTPANNTCIGRCENGCCTNDCDSSLGCKRLYECVSGQCLGETGATCTTGAGCKSHACQNGKCQSSVGGACPCGPGDVCVVNVCKRPPGGPCTSDGDCASGSCSPQSSCLAGENEVCGQTPDCAGSLVCDNGICKQPIH